MKPLWQAWLALALALGLAPEMFWRLSLSEWRALAAPHASQTMARADFIALAARFPDTRHG